MLQITVPAGELFDEKTSSFIFVKEQTLCLEHSLISVSNWESKWKKSFFQNAKKMTQEEFISYVRFMTINSNVDPNVYLCLSKNNIEELKSYIDDPMTATTFSNNKKDTGNGRNPITAEIIYYWMISYGIPFECRKWHLNKLITLIRVCMIKSGPSKKMSKRDVYNQKRAMNEARRKGLHTNG